LGWEDCKKSHGGTILNYSVKRKVNTVWGENHKPMGRGEGEAYALREGTSGDQKVVGHLSGGEKGNTANKM